MSKYIDLELALNELLRLYEEDVERYGVEIPETFDYHRAKETLLNLPTIEIVRCKDCEYFKLYESVFGKGWICTRNHKVVGSDDFCSYGERKDNE